MDMATALATAARKERSANRQIGRGNPNPGDSLGIDQAKRREDARLGSARLLDRLNAYYARRAA